MANITRIKASDTRKKHVAKDAKAAETQTPKARADQPKQGKSSKEQVKAIKQAPATPKAAKKTSKQSGKKHATPKFIRIITKPFRAFGRYLRDSWAELRQVRWPSRKATWKMTLAVIVYCGIFIVIIMGLDLLFTELFGWLLGN